MTEQVVVSRRELKQHSPNRNLLRAIRPLPEHGIIYVKNPKAGCSTVMLWLDRMHTGDYESVPPRIHTEHHLPGVREVGWDTVTQMLSGSAYRFSFVRHPVRRFESAYWDKIVHVRGVWLAMIQAELGLPDDPGAPVTFEQFLSAVEQQDPVEGMNAHWRPQHLNLLHPLVTYDRVGRLESFDDDIARIREEAGLPDVPLQARNRAKPREAGSVYDGRPDLVRRVEDLFAADFELYGY